MIASDAVCERRNPPTRFENGCGQNGGRVVLGDRVEVSVATAVCLDLFRVSIVRAVGS